MPTRRIVAIAATVPLLRPGSVAGDRLARQVPPGRQVVRP